MKKMNVISSDARLKELTKQKNYTVYVVFYCIITLLLLLLLLLLFLYCIVLCFLVIMVTCLICWHNRNNLNHNNQSTNQWPLRFHDVQPQRLHPQNPGYQATRKGPTDTRVRACNGLKEIHTFCPFVQTACY